MKKLLLVSFILAGLMLATSAMAYLDDTEWLVTVMYSDGTVFQDEWTFDMQTDYLGSINSEEFDDDGTALVWPNWRGVLKARFRFPGESLWFYGGVYTEEHSGFNLLIGTAYNYVTGDHGSFVGVLDDVND